MPRYATKSDSSQMKNKIITSDKRSDEKLMKEKKAVKRVSPDAREYKKKEKR